MNSKAFTLVALFLITLIGFGFRSFGTNWDQGQYMHPDERFLTMVITSMKWPESILEYFSTDQSPLNPHVVGFSFYVYGTWPLIIMKAISQLFMLSEYGNIHLVIRPLSAVADTLTLLFVFLTTKRIVQKHRNINFSGTSKVLAPLFAATVYASMLLPIQLSHFATVDPYMTLMMVLTLFFLTFPITPLIAAALGIVVGLAAGAKISSILIVIPVGLLFLSLFLQAYKNKKIIQQLSIVFIFGFFFYCSLRVNMPYVFTTGSLFTLNPKMVNNFKELQQYMNPDIWFPPSVQWIHAPSVLFPGLQLVFWSAGVPTILLFCISAVILLKKQGTRLLTTNDTRFDIVLLLPLVTALVLFVYQSLQFAMPARYFWPIFPMMAITIGCAYPWLINQKQLRAIHLLVVLCLIFSFFWAFAYLQIYTKPHTRVAASRWIYANIPASAVLSSEHWDDGLPLNLEAVGVNSRYKTIELPMYIPDTEEKMLEISTLLDQVDYLILSSNRVYGSITSAPEKYPLTARLYNDLFLGNLPFTPVAQFASRPTLPIPGLSLCITLPFFTYGSVDKPVTPVHKCRGIEFIDDYAEESWTVYDHPKVTIFKRKTSAVSQ